MQSKLKDIFVDKLPRNHILYKIREELHVLVCRIIAYGQAINEVIHLKNLQKDDYCRYYPRVFVFQAHYIENLS